MVTDTIEMTYAINEIIKFTENTNFKSLVKELYECKEMERKAFVKNLLLNKKEQVNRHIFTPKDITIERSYFFDERPTLFCVVKYLGNKHQKVTVTFYE